MKILIADDHALFRDTLVQYIERAEPNMELHLAKDFHETEEILTRDSEYALVILDLRMPGMRGLDGLRSIRQQYPELRFAMMSGVAEPEDVEQAIAIGAVGYFPKTLSGKALLQAIQLVLSGESYIPIDQKTNRVMSSYHLDKEDRPNITEMEVVDSKAEDMEKVKLTPREAEVLTFLMDGSSNKEIARELGLQVVTVKLHVRGICRKLSAKNRTQAAMKAKQIGFSNSASS